MSPDQKPEWLEIADADKSASPRPVAKTLPVMAFLVTVAIFGVGTVFAQTHQGSPASAVSNVTAAAAPTDQVVASTQPSKDPVVVPATSTPAAGSASMERTNPNPSIRIETVSTTESSEEPTAAPAPMATATVKAPAPIKNPSIGVKPPKGGEHEGNNNDDDDDEDEEEDDD